jgi:hypothetical protein
MDTSFKTDPYSLDYLGNKNYTDDFISNMENDFDVSLGRSFTTYDSLQYENKVKGKMKTGVMVNFKQTTSGEFDQFKNKITDEEVISKYGFNKEKLNDSVEKYMPNSDLYKNSMLVNPNVKKSYFNDKDLIYECEPPATLKD